jgi:hypothetical protein
MISTVNTVDPATLSDQEREAITDFVAAAKSNGYDPTTCEEVPGCGVFLTGEAADSFGEDLACLAVVCDELGNWTVLFRRPTDNVLLTCQFIAGKDVR